MRFVPPILIVVSFASAIFVSCGSTDLGALPPSQVVVNVANPTFTNGIQTLLTVKCASCHAGIIGQFKPANTPLIDFYTTPLALQNKASRIRARVFNSADRPMPPKFATQLTADERTALSNYLVRLTPPQ